jgi:DNA-binding NtrC family response regulator
MGKEIVVLDTDKTGSSELYGILEEQNYQVTQVESLPHRAQFFEKNPCKVAIVDIDAVSVTNRSIRQMAVKNPGTYFLCLSDDRFHPELKEAISSNIYACIKKPVFPDELFYWIGTIYK